MREMCWSGLEEGGASNSVCLGFCPALSRIEPPGFGKVWILGAQKMELSDLP